LPKASTPHDYDKFKVGSFNNIIQANKHLLAKNYYGGAVDSSQSSDL
jgi:hypothetical protein